MKRFRLSNNLFFPALLILLGLSWVAGAAGVRPFAAPEGKVGMVPAGPPLEALRDLPLPAAAYSRTDVDPARLRLAIHLAAQYLVNINKTNGEFIYRINLNPKVNPRPKYNLLRHAGTLYALGTYAQQYPDKAVLEVLNRSARFLKESFLGPVADRKDLLAVWARPEITGSTKPVSAKLGGAGLGLAGLLRVEKLIPGTVSLEELRRLGRFVLFMQKEDGSFYSKYIPSKGGRSDSWTSLYYPGEAALGLIMLYQHDPDPRWVRSAARALAFLARSRKGKQRVEPDHWALLATAALMPLQGHWKDIVSRGELIHHAVQVCERIIAGSPRHTKDRPEYGSLPPNGETCQTATRLEGLLAALTFLPEGEKALRQRIKAAADRGIAFLLRSQVAAGQHCGAVPRSIRAYPKGHPRYSRKAHRRATEVRIDYVQHALSAMLQYGQLFPEGSRGGGPGSQ